MVSVGDVDDVEDNEDTDDKKVCVLSEGAVEREEWKKEVGEDRVLQKVMIKMENGWGQKKLVDEELKPFWCIKDEWSLDDGTVFGRTRSIPPESIRKKLL
ncbi:hypothetical protein NDU88_008093 [Pleurodeles waltl]|uniref:Uncharacterized protein n=1 Tax=Pleurodeles waltl TaxID=8319 RepID=A0AAV7PQW0_PLEWA|nr:hypothetical protein NDU88_008093 [Pleurodeles waltl]